jgi:hypothetical protein
MGYPVFMGPPAAPVYILARDPHYAFDAPEAVRIDRQILPALRDGATWAATQHDIWRCRSIDPRNRLRQVRELVACASTLSVEDVYVTNLAKCGFRGAHAEPDQGRLRDRIEHCHPYLEAELRAVSTHTIISFGRHAADALAQLFDVPAPARMTENGRRLRADGRHPIFFRHWSFASGDFLQAVRRTLRRHFKRSPVGV